MDTSQLSKLYIDTTEDHLFLILVEGDQVPYTFRFTSANPSYLRHTGWTEQMIGRSIQENLPSEAVSFAQSRFTEAVEQKRPITYDETVTLNGIDLFLETKLTPFYDSEGHPTHLLGVTRDVTERKRSERYIRESEERYRALVQLSPDSIIIHDEGKIVFCNDAVAKLVQAEHPDELLGKNLYDYIPPDARRYMELRIQRLYSTGITDMPPFETKLMRGDGGLVDVEGTSAFVEHSGKKVLQVILRDVTKRTQEKEKLQRLSQLDGLTNIANRRYFDAMLNGEVNRARRNKLPISLILFDIDNFKSFNDEYGHLAGDDCLKRVTETAGRVLKRPADVLARFGGEEFAVLLPETDTYGAEIVAEQLRWHIERLAIPHLRSDVLPIVTISLGVSSMTRPSNSDILPFIERADRALYTAKHKGKNRVAIYGNQSV